MALDGIVRMVDAFFRQWDDTEKMWSEYERAGFRLVVRGGHLEHVPPQLNQGDSRGAKDGRVYRH